MDKHSPVFSPPLDFYPSTENYVPGHMRTIFDHEGEKILNSSLDEYCYVRQLTPGYIFNVSNASSLYERVLSFSNINGWWIDTPSGRKHFPPSRPSMVILAQVALRASWGDLHRENILRDRQHRAELDVIKCKKDKGKKWFGWK
jgi:hypothetical protein